MAGERVTVTWGKMLISAVQYNTFDVGPFSLETEVLPGETAEQAMARGYAILEGFARKTYAGKIEAFRAALGDAKKAMSGR